MSFLTFSGFRLLIWLTSDEKLLFTNIVHKCSNGSRALIECLQDKGRLEARSTRLFRNSFGLIHAASIPLWGHFWQNLHAWCQQVEDHELTIHFKITGAEITIKRILQDSRCLQIFACRKMGGKCSLYFSLKKHFFFLAQLPSPMSFPRAAVWIAGSLGSFPNSV